VAARDQVDFSGVKEGGSLAGKDSRPASVTASVPSLRSRASSSCDCSCRRYLWSRRRTAVTSCLSLPPARAPGRLASCWFIMRGKWCNSRATPIDWGLVIALTAMCQSATGVAEHDYEEFEVGMGRDERQRALPSAPTPSSRGRHGPTSPI
jgi:hypothetical protein